MEARIPALSLARVDVGEVAVGHVSIGAVTVGHLTVSNAVVGITSGQALLRDMRVTMRLAFTLDWWIGIDLGFTDFSDSGTTSLGTISIPFDLDDWEIPALRDIRLDIPQLTGSSVRTEVDPLTGVRVTGVQGEAVTAADVTAPAAGFTLAGIGLDSATVDDVTVPAVSIARAGLGQARGDPIALPPMRLRGIDLPSAAASDIRSGPLDLPLRSRERMRAGGLDVGFFRATLFVRPSAGTRASQMHMSGVRASAKAQTVDLRDVTLPWQAHDITLADIGVHSVAVPALSVATP